MTNLENQAITDVREMTDEEYDQLYWTPDNLGRATVLVLENGTRVFASCDTEGNHAGFLAGANQDQDALIGATIESVAPMSEASIRQRGWTVNAHRPAPPVLTLDNGRHIYPLRDGEANGPGALYHIDPETNETYMTAFEKAENPESDLFDGVDG